jgi:hypothetical protein
MELPAVSGRPDVYTLRVFAGPSLVVLAGFCLVTPGLAVGSVVSGRTAPPSLLIFPAFFALFWAFARERTTVTAQGVEVVDFLRPARRYEWDEIEGFGVGGSQILLELKGDRGLVSLPGAQSKSLSAGRRASRLRAIVEAIASFDPSARPVASP